MVLRPCTIFVTVDCCLCVFLCLQNRAIVPGLFESYYPRGLSVLDDDSYLMTFHPVGDNAGRPSLIVRMEKKKNGKIMRIYQLYEEDGTTPFTGTVKDVTVSGRDTVTPNLPYFVWTCDDTYDPYVGLAAAARCAAPRAHSPVAGATVSSTLAWPVPETTVWSASSTGTSSSRSAVASLLPSPCTGRTRSR